MKCFAEVWEEYDTFYEDDKRATSVERGVPLTKTYKGHAFDGTHFIANRIYENRPRLPKCPQRKLFLLALYLMHYLYTQLQE